MKISLIAFDDFTDLDLIMHWDLLSRVRTIGGKKDWDVKILGTKAHHISTLGLPIPTHGPLEEAEGSQGIIICSGRGTRPLLKDSAFLARLALNPNKQFIGAQCSGSLILGALGFLSGRSVSAY